MSDRATASYAPVSPAAQHIIDGEPFDLDGDHFYVDTHLGCGGDPIRDVLVIRGVEYMRCDERKVRRAVQVRDVELWIAQDRVCFPFGPSALGMNIAKGWPAEAEEVEFYGQDYERLHRLLFSNNLMRRARA